METIQNIIVNNGSSEIHSEEIYGNANLQNLVNRTILFKGLSTLIEKINLENGLLYIYTDSDFNSTNVELRNVSLELQDEYSKIAGN